MNPTETSRRALYASVGYKSPAVYYAVSLGMLRADGTDGCGYVTSNTSLDAAVAEAFRMATFYLADRGDGSVPYASVKLTVTEHCMPCNGSGYTSRTPRRSVKCKACKGTGGERPVFETIVAAYDNGRDAVRLTYVNDVHPTTKEASS